MKRECGDCQLCCKLVPVREIEKAANTTCKHQCATSCGIYEQRPNSCRLWSCSWLKGSDTADLPRPDEAGYVIDMLTDTVIVSGVEIPCIQIWCDPDRPDAWRTPQMMAFIDRRAKSGMLALVRYANDYAITVFGPSICDDNEWHEIGGPPNTVLHETGRKLAS